MTVRGCFGGETAGPRSPAAKSVNARVPLYSTSSCWNTLSFRSCNALTTPSTTPYFSRIMLQCILHQLPLDCLSSTTSRSTNTLLAGPQSHRTWLGSPQATASQTVSRYR